MVQTLKYILQKKKLIILLVLFALYMPAAHGADPLVELNTEEYPPFNYIERGKIIGVSTEIIDELMYRNRIKTAKHVLPWARAMALAKDQPFTCVYSTSRTPERESQYRWIGPLVVNEWVLFAKKSNKKPPKSLDEVKNANIGTYIGDAIETYLRNNNYKLQASKTDEINIKKLNAEHIDYWATGRLIGLHLLKIAGEKNIKPVLTFNKTEMYLACNKNFPQELIDKLNADLKSNQMQKFKIKIYKNYGYSL